MSKERALIGTDGQPLPVLPPERDARVWARVCRILFYAPGFLALLLLKAGEPTAFGISIELLMLASTAAIVAGLFIGSNSDAAGADHASRTGAWSGALVVELLGVVPLLCAVPTLFHELANSKVLHAVSGTMDIQLGATELIPAAAILPFMLYQLAGHGTLHFVLPKAVNWAVNLGILALIVAAYATNRAGNFAAEKVAAMALVASMVVLVFYGVLRLRDMQERYDEFHPAKAAEKAK